jgi:hypothetical protein
MFVPLDLHIYIYYNKRAIVLQTLL